MSENKKVTPEELVKIKTEIVPFLREIRNRETKFNHVHCQSSIDLSDYAFESLVTAIGELECYHDKRQKKIDADKYEELMIEVKAQKQAERKKKKNEMNNSLAVKRRTKPAKKKYKKYAPRERIKL